MLKKLFWGSALTVGSIFAVVGFVVHKINSDIDDYLDKEWWKDY